MIEKIIQRTFKTLIVILIFLGLCITFAAVMHLNNGADLSGACTQIGLGLFLTTSLSICLNLFNKETDEEGNKTRRGR